ncbi:MAG: glycosyltransferase family 87 protein [Chloroflexota bacterium]
MVERASRLIAMTFAVLGVLLLMGAALNGHVQPDADAYWHAALRLRDGQPLYGGPRGDETELYRYAPWFAFGWVPLTYLGQDAALMVWRGILLLSTVVAVWPLIRRPTPASVTLAILLGGLLVTNLPAANVTPLIVGSLAAGIRTRLGPVLLGLAASLKLFPLVLVAGYLAERRWRAAGVAVAVGSVLWLQVLAFDLPLYLQIGGPSFYLGGVSLLRISPLVWFPIAVAAAGAVVALAWRRSPWTWLAATAAIPLAVPRVWLPDAAYLLISVPAATDEAVPGHDAARGEGLLRGTRDRIERRTLGAATHVAVPRDSSVEE